MKNFPTYYHGEVELSPLASGDIPYLRHGDVLIRRFDNRVVRLSLAYPTEHGGWIRHYKDDSNEEEGGFAVGDFSLLPLQGNCYREPMKYPESMQ